MSTVEMRRVPAERPCHMCMLRRYATLSRLAGIDPTDEVYDSNGHPLPPIDSLDMWPYLSGATNASPRLEIPLTVGPHSPGCGGGLIVGQYKVLFGLQMPAIMPGPEYPNGTKPAPIYVDCGDRGCLYDIFADPTEHEDLALRNDSATEALLANLTARFGALALTAYQTPWVEQTMNCSAPRVQKMLRSGFWAPYTDDHAPDPLSTSSTIYAGGCPRDARIDTGALIQV